MTLAASPWLTRGARGAVASCLGARSADARGVRASARGSLGARSRGCSSVVSSSPNWDGRTALGTDNARSAVAITSALSLSIVTYCTRIMGTPWFDELCKVDAALRPRRTRESETHAAGQ